MNPTAPETGAETVASLPAARVANRHRRNQRPVGLRGELNRAIATAEATRAKTFVVGTKINVVESHIAVAVVLLTLQTSCPPPVSVVTSVPCRHGIVNLRLIWLWLRSRH